MNKESSNAMNLEILYKSKNIVVIYKPPLISSQSDISGDKDALTMTAEMLSMSGEREELYLINRLDKVVGGLMIFARNKRFARILSEKLAGDEFIKEYLAVTDGEAVSGEISDMMVKDSVRNMGIVVKDNRSDAKLATLYSEVIETTIHKEKKKSLINVRLKTGRFHQIRSQMSNRGTPLTGDKKYGSKDFMTRQPALFAYHISVQAEDEKIDVYKLPDIEKYPWNLFSAEKYVEKTRKIL